MAEKKPETEDGLGQDVENSVGNDLSINGGLARTVGKTPDTIKMLVSVISRKFNVQLTWGRQSRG